MQLDSLKTLHENHKEKRLKGRYIYNQMILPLLENLPIAFVVNHIGKSVLDNDIYSVTFGSGEKKILMWSQMHGNESTTTKALFDLFNSFNDSQLGSILEKCTIKVIPILNPDGANAYTRVNANKVDLNRDAQSLSQPESIILKKIFNSFKPDFCFNLHGQRTIFSAGVSQRPATVSFLAPAQDKQCSITLNRKKAMEVIVAMNSVLQKVIPNQVGVYDDAFNLNCVGDTFQNLNIPTILFEAGHYPNDYKREHTRKYIFFALLTSVNYISNNEVVGENYEPYFNIPQNKKLLVDILIKNAKIINKSSESILDIAIQYEETLDNEEIKFVPKVKKISNQSNLFGHKVIDAFGAKVKINEINEIKEGNEIDFVIINNEKYSLKLMNT